MKRDTLKGFLIGAASVAVLGSGTVFAASSVVKATLGHATLQYNGHTVSKGADLQYKGKAYVALSSVESVLHHAGLGYKWHSNTLNVTKSSGAKSTKSTVSSHQKGITFSNIIIKGDGIGDTIVDGEVTNHDKVQHTFFLTVSFFSKSGKLLGTATGAVDGIGAGQTKTFEAMGTGDYTGAASYKVQTDVMM